jgi:hypothetical protein
MQSLSHIYISRFSHRHFSHIFVIKLSLTHAIMQSLAQHVRRACIATKMYAHKIKSKLYLKAMIWKHHWDLRQRKVWFCTTGYHHLNFVQRGERKEGRSEPLEFPYYFNCTLHITFHRWRVSTSLNLPWIFFVLKIQIISMRVFFNVALLTTEAVLKRTQMLNFTHPIGWKLIGSVFGIIAQRWAGMQMN